MTFQVPKELEDRINEVITHYPVKRSASLPTLHLLQEHFGYITPAAIEWTAQKLELQPINIWELVTFYPMFRQKPVGRFHIKVCRTLSCELGGCKELCSYLQQKTKAPLGGTSDDGRFTIEYVECLASCGSAPVMMVNDEFYEGVTQQKADDILGKLSK